MLQRSEELGPVGLKGQACRRLVPPHLRSPGAECKRLKGAGRSSRTASAASGASQQGQSGCAFICFLRTRDCCRTAGISTARLQAACTASPRLKRLPGAAWGVHTDPAELQSSSASRLATETAKRSSQVLKLAAPVVLGRPEGRRSCLNDRKA